MLGTEAGLRLAVDNLLVNALRHSGGQTVAVSVDADPAAGWARVLVDDDGRGLPAGERARCSAGSSGARPRSGRGPGWGWPWWRSRWPTTADGWR